MRSVEQAQSSRDSSSDWVKSSLSYANGGCVEVSSRSPGLIRVRDSKNPRGHILGFTPADWGIFLTAIRNGRFDR